jgi:hypothetical protein
VVTLLPILLASDWQLSYHRPMATTTTTETIWRRDMDNLSAQLEPFSFEIEGDFYLTSEAPAALADIYSKMLRVGYAKGWMA